MLKWQFIVYYTSHSVYFYKKEQHWTRQIWTRVLYNYIIYKEATINKSFNMFKTGGIGPYNWYQLVYIWKKKNKFENITYCLQNKFYICLLKWCIGKSNGTWISTNTFQEGSVFPRDAETLSKYVIIRYPHLIWHIKWNACIHVFSCKLLLCKWDEPLERCGTWYLIVECYMLAFDTRSPLIRFIDNAAIVLI